VNALKEFKFLPKLSKLLLIIEILNLFNLNKNIIKHFFNNLKNNNQYFCLRQRFIATMAPKHNHII